MGYMRTNMVTELKAMQLDLQQKHVKELALALSQLPAESNFQELLLVSSSPSIAYFLIDLQGDITHHSNVQLVNRTIEQVYGAELLIIIKEKINGSYWDAKNSILYSFTPVPTFGQIIVSANSDPLLFSAARKFETNSLMQLGLSLAFISLLAGFIIWFVVGRPVRTLTTAARQIADGQLDTIVKIEGMSDELYILGATFNQMSNRIEELVGGLENNLYNLSIAQNELKKSEDRYRSIFETASVALMEEDFTDAMDILDNLKKSGVSNIRTFLNENPDLVKKLISSVLILDVNQMATNFFGVSHKQDILGSMEKIYTSEILPVFKEEFITLFRGIFSFESEITLQNLADKRLQALMRMHIPNSEHRPIIALMSMMDITEQKQNSLRIQEQVEHLSALRQIDMAIASHLDLRSTLNILLTQIRRQLKVDAVNILQFNPQLSSLQYVTSIGFLTGALQNTRLRIGEGFAGRAALERGPLYIRDLNDKANPFRNVRNFPQENFVSYYGIPMIAKGEIKGVLEIFHRSALNITAEWEEFIKDLTTQGAMAIETATLWEEQNRINEELRAAYDNTLNGWARTLEIFDFETHGHSERVIDLTVRLAQKMKVRNEELIHIRRGVLLHDIGKIGVGLSIVNKPGPLNEEEWHKMREHPNFARRILEPIAFLRPCTDIPYYHHEWWDGNGYPENLSGEQIPLAARIFAIIDVWDALNHKRPYRDAWEPEKVLSYIQGLSGKKFDPKIVAAFFELLEEDSDSFP
jgi:HAMP domain-containing protein/GAF domain-containing protein